MGDTVVEDMLATEESEKITVIRISNVCSQNAPFLNSNNPVCRKLQFDSDHEFESYQETCSDKENILKSNEEQVLNEAVESTGFKNEKTHALPKTSGVREQLDTDIKEQVSNGNTEAHDIVIKEEHLDEFGLDPPASLPKLKVPDIQKSHEISDDEVSTETQMSVSGIISEEPTELTYTTLTAVHSDAYGEENENPFLLPRVPFIHHPVIPPQDSQNASRPVAIKFHPVGIPHPTRMPPRSGNPSTPYPRTIVPGTYPPARLAVQQGWQGSNLANSFNSVQGYRIPTSGSELSDTSSTDSSNYITPPFSSSSSSFVSSEDTTNSSPEYKSDESSMFSGQSFVTPDGQHVTQYKDAFGNIRYYYPAMNERENHNVKERKRRSRVAESCSILRSLIPGLSDKTDKATVFEYAARYLTFLREKFGMQYDQAYIDKYFSS